MKDLWLYGEIHAETIYSTKQKQNIGGSETRVL
jgi:hypothetical protein